MGPHVHRLQLQQLSCGRFGLPVSPPSSPPPVALCEARFRLIYFPVRARHSQCGGKDGHSLDQSPGSSCDN